MSYDIWLNIDTGGPEPATVWSEFNFTSNVAPMWRAAGADLAEFDGKRAGDCALILAGAIAELEGDPAKYRAMDSPNGWGTYDHLLPALRKLLAGFQQHPSTTVVVWR